jgi:hypothetical protein
MCVDMLKLPQRHSRKDFSSFAKVSLGGSGAAFMNLQPKLTISMAPFSFQGTIPLET